MCHEALPFAAAPAGLGPPGTAALAERTRAAALRQNVRTSGASAAVRSGCGQAGAAGKPQRCSPSWKDAVNRFPVGACQLNERFGRRLPDEPLVARESREEKGRRCGGGHETMASTVRRQKASARGRRARNVRLEPAGGSAPAGRGPPRGSQGNGTACERDREVVPPTSEERAAALSGRRSASTAER